MKGKKTGGRTRKNFEGEKSKRIHHTPSQEALDAYKTWPEKSENMDQAIIEHTKRINK